MRFTATTTTTPVLFLTLYATFLIFLFIINKSSWVESRCSWSNIIHYLNQFRKVCLFLLLSLLLSLLLLLILLFHCFYFLFLYTTTTTTMCPIPVGKAIGRKTKKNVISLQTQTTNLFSNILLSFQSRISSSYFGVDEVHLSTIEDL